MRHLVKSILAAVWICSILLAFSGCAAIKELNTTPTVQEVEQRFESNRDDILTVVDFLVESEHEDILIWDADGTMKVDLDPSDSKLDQIAIYDEDVRTAVDHLLGRGAYKRIMKDGNTIDLPQWYSSQQQGCGIAYSINGIDLPEVDYVTEYIPLDEEGWYYYAYDYNEWRVEQARGTGQRTGDG